MPTAGVARPITRQGGNASRPVIGSQRSMLPTLTCCYQHAYSQHALNSL
ncbi:hypothetical protein OOK29_32565 [Streptomyces phaeochromogenes]|nr:hypothetical protein [Streptomyces phaeochromogenes]MCX5602882.1 hypothetical protein [Streptomyces phaeochromogenes]WRZ26358.1 hypothetical protein OG931_00660 [Streptomyces phaeochromogenes]WSJ11282.1 hypothetical protein OG437_50490 [Streptomyces phaeochromogenes]WTA01420.1 hypothetical protein OHB08_03300 [Streptomyces phaeochromogenes]